MYTIKVDGQEFYSPALSRDYLVLSPSIKAGTDGSSSFSFVVPPLHPLKEMIRQIASIITVEDDGEEIFRGRAVDYSRDFYNQVTYYCEGQEAFLHDSLFNTKDILEKAADYFRALVESHNGQVDETRRFTIGIVDAVEASVNVSPSLAEESDPYINTFDAVKGLIAAHGGYLRAHGGVLDWVKDYAGDAEQPIRFAVNLLDISETNEGNEVFTELLPLGFYEIGDDGNYTTPVGIESVNGGVPYIQDADLVAKYGRIRKTFSWPYEKDPARLLAYAKERLKQGDSMKSLRIRAVDMHFVDGVSRPIRLGCSVSIESDPHGINRQEICTAIDLDLIAPENTVYTFDHRLQTLTDEYKKTDEDARRASGRGGGGGGFRQELKKLLTWADDYQSDEKARYLITTGRMNELGETLSSAEIRLDGLEATIELKVSKDGLISAINMSPEEIVISSSKINLNGYVTTSKLNAELASITNQISIKIATSELSAATVRCTNLYVGGAKADFTTVKYKDGDGNTKTIVVLAQ